MVGSYDKAELKDLKLEKSTNGLYFLNATYEYENKYGVYEFNIPKIELPVYQHGLPDYRIDFHMVGPSDLTVNLGFGELQALNDFDTGMTHQITQVKKKTQKMTLAEIEAKLGYSIELVSEK